MESLLESLVGPATSGIRGQIQDNAMSRGNTPIRWQDNLAGRGRPPAPGTLWIGELGSLIISGSIADQPAYISGPGFGATDCNPFHSIHG
jgi:hypothetical protein